MKTPEAYERYLRRTVDRQRQMDRFRPGRLIGQSVIVVVLRTKENIQRSVGRTAMTSRSGRRRCFVQSTCYQGNQSAVVADLATGKEYPDDVADLHDLLSTRGGV